MHKTGTWTLRLAMLAGAIGALLFCLNIYGLTQSLRPVGLTPDVLRFKEQDLLISEQQLSSELQPRQQESSTAFARRATYAIADGIAHIHWERYSPGKFHQHVPVWENYILWGMRYLTNIPEYERYHFSNVDKSIERGIGICGDASILLSQILTKEGIGNQIVSMPDHVIVRAAINGQELLLDGDFGVVANISLKHAAQNPDLFMEAYAAEQKYDHSVKGFAQGLATNYQTWDGPKAFITKKYYFEKLSYILKWLLPVCLMGLTLTVVLRRRISRSQATMAEVKNS